MAVSAVARERLGSRYFLKPLDHDPGATGAVLASPDGGTTPWYLDMSLYSYASCLVRSTVAAAAGVTRVQVYASVDIAGAINATLIKDSGVKTPSSNLNSFYFLEWAADEVAWAAAGAGVAGAAFINLRYITVAITCATNTDEADLIWFAEPKFPTTGLTATTIV